MIDKLLLKFFDKLDWISDQIDKIFAPRCKCKRKNKK